MTVHQSEEFGALREIVAVVVEGEAEVEVGEDAAMEDISVSH